MKKIYLIILTLCSFSFAKATNEVPNSGFETWASGNPTGWFTGNSVYGNAITQTTPAHGGTYALKGQPVISTLTSDTVAPSASAFGSGGGFPITTNYSNLEFYYKSNLVSGDEFVITITIYDASFNPLGVGAASITSNASSFTKADVSIDPITSGTPAKAILSFVLLGSDGDPNLNSYFIIDDVALNDIAGVKELSANSRLQVYPVPAHDWLTVKGETDNNQPMQFVLADAAGRIVMEKKSESSDVIDEKLNLQGIAPGFYSLLLVSDKETSMRRIVVE